MTRDMKISSINKFQIEKFVNKDFFLPYPKGLCIMTPMLPTSSLPRSNIFSRI